MCSVNATERLNELVASVSTAAVNIVEQAETDGEEITPPSSSSFSPLLLCEEGVEEVDSVPLPSAFIRLTAASNGCVFPSAAVHLQRCHLGNGLAAPPGFTFTRFRVDDPL